MARFVKRVLLFVAIQLVILGYVVWAGRISDDTYYSAMEDKIARLESIEGPRVIILGGSNAVFGIDSQRVARGLAGEPVNVALHAGVGYGVYLELVEAHVRAGDTVVFIPEYELVSGVASETIQAEMLASCPSVRPYLRPDESRWRHWKALLDHESLQLVHTWTHNAFRRRRSENGVYYRGSFNEFGDMVGHYGLPAPEKESFGPIRITDEELTAFLDRVNRFCDRCESAGATVCFSFAPIDEERFEQSRETLASLESTLRSGLHAEIIDTPSENVFSRDEFFDSYYHLTEVAARRRSDRLNVALVGRVAMKPTEQVRR